MERDGAPGFWVPSLVLRGLVADRDRAERRAVVLADLSDTLRLMNELEVRTASRAEARVEQLELELVETADELEAALEAEAGRIHPALWVGAGAAAVLVVELVTFLLLSR